MSEVSLLPPLRPHQLPKDLRRFVSRIVDRLTVAAAVRHVPSSELLATIYMAGFQHGAWAQFRLDHTTEGKSR